MIYGIGCLGNVEWNGGAIMLTMAGGGDGYDLMGFLLGGGWLMVWRGSCAVGAGSLLIGVGSGCLWRGGMVGCGL